MLGLLSLGVCIACISCLCCICTATIVTTPGLIDLRTGTLLCGKRQCNESRRKSNEFFPLSWKKNLPHRTYGATDGSESESCPCAITYVIEPILQSRNPQETCNELSKKKKYCRCPSFLDLVGDYPGSPGKILPRS